MKKLQNFKKNKNRKLILFLTFFLFYSQNQISAKSNEIEMREFLSYEDKNEISKFALPSIYFLDKKNYLKKNKKFYPQKKIKRVILLSLIMNIKNIEIEKNQNCSFSDVQKNKWYYDIIATAQKNHLISGHRDFFGKTKNQFFPEQNISREDAVIMIQKSFEIPMNLKIKSIFLDLLDEKKYFYKSVISLYNYCIINGKNNYEFGTGQELSREEAMMMIKSAINFEEEDFKKNCNRI